MLWKRSLSVSSTEETEPLLVSNYSNNDSVNQGYIYKNKYIRHVADFGRSHRSGYREYLAEFIGTCVLCIFLCGVSAEQLLNEDGNKTTLAASIGSGLAVLIAISISGHVSGAHINPAVTITFWAFSGFPTKKVFGFIFSQFLGAFTGASILFGVIYPAINEFDNGIRQIYGKQGTAPNYSISSVISEIVGTALLCLIIMSTGHKNNLPFKNAQGCFIAVGIVVISLTFGYTSGLSLNPARDFGPRLFASIAGWGFDVFKDHDYYFLVPLITPLFGGLIGGAVYTVFIDQ
ncbi:aquaporin-like protein [Cunninghamella echinulata]|nr:aquaporin-like protein [Cunninghamella echinulata]